MKFSSVPKLFSFAARESRGRPLDSSSESSLINLNEATGETLQQLSGIGPLRARRIISYREEVAPLKNVFDLAAATGMSLKQAQPLTDRITWSDDKNSAAFGIAPFVLTTLATLYLVVVAMTDAISSDTLLIRDSFELGLITLLIGLLVNIIDMSFWNGRFSKAGVIISLTGAGLMLLTLGYSAITGDLSSTSESMLKATTFLGATITISLLMYGPTVSLRYLTSADRVITMIKVQTWFDLVQPVFLVPALYVAYSVETGVAIEEIFCVWTVVLMLSAASDLMRLRSPFESSLSNLDQGRFRFMKRYNQAPAIKQRLSRTVGVITIAGSVWLLALVTQSLTLT